jgi:PKD repeat protein
MWGLSPSDNNSQINAYKIAQGITNPCAGTEGGGPDAIDIVTTNQNFLGYPTYIVICPDKSIFFDVCWPPSSASCFDPYIEDCGALSLTANFSSSATDICQFDEVLFQDESVGAVTTWLWTFEGGIPETSTEQNPSVTYELTGTFDVTLEVSDGSSSNTLFIENYIDVQMTPPTMLQPFDDVCLTDPAFELTGGSPIGGTYSGTGVDNGWFDPGVAGLGTHTITYTYAAANGCENFDEQTILVDACTGIHPNEDETFSLYPNPTTGRFEIRSDLAGPTIISVYNLLGVEVYRINGQNDPSEAWTIDLSNLPTGLYLVRVESGSNESVQKVRINK